MPSANEPNKGVLAKFHLKEKVRPDGSIEMLEYLEITHAGDKHYRRDQRVTPQDIERFPDEYRRFKAGIVDQMGGTRLVDAATALSLTVPRITELAACNIYTVEQLSNVTDGNLPGLGLGGRTLRERAREWLEEQMTKPDPMEEIAQLRAQIEAMREEKRKPGRPRKEQEAA